MSIILVRHGETALNAARVLQPADTPLSARGLAQAAALGRRLAAHGVGAVVGSDLARAWQTALAIGDACALPPSPSTLLHERNFGDLRGRPYDGLGFDPLTLVQAPPQGESAAEFAARVRLALEAMLRWHARAHGDLVVVTHGLLIRVLLAGPLQVAPATLGALHLGNTSVSIFDAGAPHRLSLLNCTRHLDATMSDDTRSLSGG